MSMLIEIQELSDDIFKLEQAMETLLANLDDLDGGLHVKEVVDSLSILIHAKRIYRASLIARVELYG